MAKQPEVRERFRIHADVPAEAPLSLLTALTKMGFENIGYETVEDVPTYKKNGAAKKYDVPGNDFAAAWIAEHPSFHIGELAKHFMSQGRSASQAYMIVKTMAEAGTLVSLPDKNFRRADIKELAPPKTRLPSRSTGPRNHTPINREFILLNLPPDDKFQIKTMEELFGDAGRPRQSAGPTIAVLVQKGMLRGQGEGWYTILKKARLEAAKLATAALNAAGDSHE